jgi:steroid delta-isomerase-like uncharacterized protein
MHKNQVRRFYKELWDAHNKEAIPSILHEDFSFRGSLGQEKRGHGGFSEYVDEVHQALGDYKCIMEEIVSEGDKVFAKMLFTGIHRDRFLGYPPTGKRVSWNGCALFTFKDDLISDVWVLGDLKSLEQQLSQNAA